MKTCLAAVMWVVLGAVLTIDAEPWLEMERAGGGVGDPLSLRFQVYGFGRGQLERSKDLRSWEAIHAMELPREGTLRILRRSAEGQEFYRFDLSGFAVPTDLVWIGPGAFDMGSPAAEAGRREDEGPQRRVILQYGFWMGRWEVTVREFHGLMGWNPTPEAPADSTRPVAQVTWDEAREYCRRRTARDRVANAIPAGASYRLPSEAEWEFACRAGSATRYSFGDDRGYSTYGYYGWSALNSNQSSHPVGEKKANAWGLHDMHGNVFEWCLDHYGAYPGGASLNGITNHVYRGGSWYCSDIAYLRSGSRHPGNQSSAPYIGFRLVLGSEADSVLR